MDSAQREVLIQTYGDGPAKLQAAVAEAPEAMRKWRPEAGEFSVHEVGVHCADSETNSHGRIRYLVAEDNATIIGYDPDGWARKFAYHDLPLEAALLTVEAVRANTVPILRRMSEEDWASAGTHTESGAYTAEDWLRTYAAHLEEHTLQVQGVVAAWEAAGRPQP
ncbi:MAG: DinB family protein [Chloroflexi bacterium]|nr:DinB family protein [Chloroflexota bacterium]MCI0840057.1 DinB family protein [Chloroflexota bacterium]